MKTLIPQIADQVQCQRGDPPRRNIPNLRGRGDDPLDRLNRRFKYLPAAKEKCRVRQANPAVVHPSKGHHGRIFSAESVVTVEESLCNPLVTMRGICMPTDDVVPQ